MHLEQAAQLWFQHLANRNRSGYPKQVEYLLRAQLLPVLGTKPLVEIKKADLVAAIDCAAQRGPSNARHLYAYSRTLFRWACSRDLLERSPAEHISPVHLLGPAAFRTRILSDGELSAIWTATAELGRFGAIVRLLALTGQRRSEVCGMRWDELSGLDGREPVWTIEATRYKSRVQHRIPLSALAMRELHGLPRNGPLVFPSARVASTRPFSGVGKLKAKLDAGSGVSGWTLHDLRRTMRTRMAGLGVADPVAEACLGHGKRGLERIYNLHRYEAEMRLAFGRWAGHLAGIGAGDRESPS